VVPFPEKSIEVSDPVIKVTRVIEVIGKASWVYSTLDPSKALVNPGRQFVTPHGTITETRRIVEES
jgi:hypothetical protein